MPPMVGRSLRRCWHPVMSSTDPEMKATLPGASTSGARLQPKIARDARGAPPAIYSTSWVADELWAHAADQLRQAGVMTGQVLVRLSSSIQLLADEVIK
jgi:hypothetical protein